MIDFTVTQIIQEGIVETERGVVNGVQNALQCCMDLVKNVLVVLLPSPKTFGLLVIVSYAVVSAGHVSYAVYARKKLSGQRMPQNEEKAAADEAA